MRFVAMGVGLVALAAGGEAGAQGRAGCAAGLRGAVDAASFAGAGGASRRAIEALRVEAERSFHTVAGAMCASGELRPAALRPFRRLLVQYGGGASETAVYVDPAQPGALIFQYAFEPGRGGRFDVPAPGDVRDGIRCWAAPRRNARMCAERTP